MNEIAEDILMHYGVKYRSGRYPYGSGDNPYQHADDFLARHKELKSKGLKETDIAKEMDLSTTQLRIQLQRAKHEQRAVQAAKAKSMREDGKTLMEIADALGFKNDSSVRALLNKKTEANKNIANNVADTLEKELESKDMINVGKGANLELGVSEGKFKEALEILKEKGYNVHPVSIPQATNIGKQINTKVLCRSDVTHAYVYQNRENIREIGNYHSKDGGRTFTELQYPASIDSKRIKIRTKDEGGIDKDGVVEIRRGVKDLDLGNSHYAQVRILVDGNKYIKGMAMYSDNMPPGVDIVINSSKNDADASLKKIKTEDPKNPFGAYIKADGQSYYKDPNGKFTDPVTGEKVSLSPINKLREEGEWDTMSRNLSSQFLSKQPQKLIDKQLKLTRADYKDRFEEIKSYQNPTIKRKLLEDFADECERAAVHMKAAALPRQSSKVILPLTSLKDNEIYAPSYKNGEKLALVRYPHGSIMEIPILTVNNKHAEGKKAFGNMQDAVAINPETANRLSGADFDGDFVICIPHNDKVQINSKPLHRDLVGYEPKDIYATDKNFKGKLMTKADTQKKMGEVSNLITDMTLKGAPESDVVKAIKHSMTVIDAEKHKLDYQQSEIDNDIKTLKNRWQRHIDPITGKESGGASTLLSMRKQEVKVPETRGSGVKNKETGKYEFKETGRTYKDPKTGQIKTAMKDISKVLYVDDVRSMSSGTSQENAYADHANYMKALANEARKTAWNTDRLKYSPSAKKTYQEEVDSINAKLNIALKNGPREQRAQAIAYGRWKSIIKANPDMTKKDQKKLRQLAIDEARTKVGADGKGSRISLTDAEWKAINAGAISDSKLDTILKKMDPEDFKKHALPKQTSTLSTARQAKIRSMNASGYTLAEIADSLNISPSTVSKYIK